MSRWRHLATISDTEAHYVWSLEVTVSAELSIHLQKCNMLDLQPTRHEHVDLDYAVLTVSGIDRMDHGTCTCSQRSSVNAKHKQSMIGSPETKEQHTLFPEIVSVRSRIVSHAAEHSASQTHVVSIAATNFGRIGASLALRQAHFQLISCFGHCQ